MGTHASECTKWHALYMYFFLGMQKTDFAALLCKHGSTITNWINNYLENGNVSHKKSLETVYQKFGNKKRSWIMQLYEKKPCLYLDEAQL
ncbi:hypothetical protein HK096_001857, partial [Nowakowskiella sp. JEL0078]